MVITRVLPLDVARDVPLCRRAANYGNSLNDVERTSLPQSSSVLAVDFSALLE